MERKNRNHIIDIIKGIAIIFVVVTHYRWKTAERNIFLFPFIINMAVPAFMIITGYVYSLSLERKRIQKLEDAYQWRIILKKVTRYSIPMFAVIAWELCDNKFAISPGILERVRWGIDGTDGSGSYYYPVMMQLIFTFPLIYFLIEKKGKKGLYLSLIGNSIYEVLSWAYKIPTPSYRLLMFRYIFLIAVGVYAFKGYKLSLRLNILMILIGSAFIISITYLGYEPKMMNSDWASTNFISSMLIIPLMIWLLQHNKTEESYTFQPLEIIGRASYHIFLVQMVYYAGYYTTIQEMVTTRKVHFIVGMVISIIIGVLFYYIDRVVQGWIERKIIEKH